MLNQIIIDNQNLIYSIINKYTNYYDKEDLFQTASLGLIKAYKNYKTNMNTKFSTYSYTYILSEVLLYINNNKDIKLGRDYQKLYKKILESKNILTQRLMKEPTTYELSLFLEIDEKIIINILDLTKKFKGLYDMISIDGQNLCILDTIKDKEKDNMIDRLILKEEINKLSNEEKQLLWMRYYCDNSQQEVAQYMNKNQVYISRNEKKVLRKLKDSLDLNR